MILSYAPAARLSASHRSTYSKTIVVGSVATLETEDASFILERENRSRGEAKLGVSEGCAALQLRNRIHTEVYFKDEPKTGIHHRTLSLQRDTARRRRPSPNRPDSEHRGDSTSSRNIGSCQCQRVSEPRATRPDRMQGLLSGHSRRARSQ